jgi:serine phosphatase RsbU (regulator of sigma subunit)/HAMP domain-containing protein
MAFRFTIGRKIGLGFGILIFLTLFAFGLTMLTLRESREINNKITEIYTPSVSALKELNLLVVRSKTLINSWVNIPKESEDKVTLKKLIYEQHPPLKVRINQLAASPEWNDSDRNDIAAIFSLIDQLFEDHKDIMRQLNSFASYDDAEIKFGINIDMDEDGKINQKTRQIEKLLIELIATQEQKADVKISEMLESFALLQRVVVILGIALPLGGLLIAFFTVRTIVRPVYELKKILLNMSRGVLPQDKIRDRKDEIGEMSVALNELVSAMKLTTEFAKEVGSGNFDSYYKPMSGEDTLGLALLRMREDLAENERMLEQKVEERTAEVVRQKHEIEMQAQKIEVLYNHVTDSIKYAKRIQEAILPPEYLMKKLLPQSFVFYKPKDIVSGDFYWIEQLDSKILFAAVDCTGHGVPGAFMSIVGHNLLKRTIARVERIQPSKILDELSRGVSETLHQNYTDVSAKDGMDMSICALDTAKKELEFAGAFNPLYLIRDGQLQEIKGNKFPVGIFLGREGKNFTNHKIGLQKGDMLYIFSDGYADQFGGPKGKKFMQNKFRDLLLKIHEKSMEQQKTILDSTLEAWKGDEEQVDDILVMGIKIH